MEGQALGTLAQSVSRHFLGTYRVPSWCWALLEVEEKEKPGPGGLQWTRGRESGSM